MNVAPTRPEPEHLKSGRLAEEQAKTFLERQGLRFVERNFRSRTGEIDLVMDDHGTLVFVEVRYRRSRHFGGAIESVNSAKRKRLLATAHGYLALHRRANSPARFDVVAIEPSSEDALSCTWIKDAIQDD